MTEESKFTLGRIQTDKYTLTPETSGYVEAFRLIQEAKNQAFCVYTSIYGEEQLQDFEAFQEAMDKASDELFKLIRINMELNLGMGASYKAGEVTV
jgi:hypothetical protein